jgi:hypothetical protein
MNSDSYLMLKCFAFRIDMMSRPTDKMHLTKEQIVHIIIVTELTAPLYDAYQGGPFLCLKNWG